MTRRIAPVLALAAASGLTLAGCAAAAPEGGDSGSSAPSIVASTSVYADLTRAIVGDAAEVTAIIDSASVDPHDYEATVQDQLAVTEADLVVFNGGGY